MTIKQFIEKAEQGGLSSSHMVLGKYPLQNVLIHNVQELVLLDPEAWKAVGKVEGWNDQREMYCTVCRRSGSQLKDCSCEGQVYSYANWHEYMHRMIDALADGKTIEEYLAML